MAIDLYHPGLLEQVCVLQRILHHLLVLLTDSLCSSGVDYGLCLWPPVIALTDMSSIRGVTGMIVGLSVHGLCV